MKRTYMIIAAIVLIAVVLGAALTWYYYYYTPTTTTKMITIGHTDVAGMRHPYWVSYWKGMQDAAAYYGNVTLIYYDSEQNLAKQLDQVQDMISRKVDVITVGAIDSDGIVPAVIAANTAGIPFIAQDIAVGMGATPTVWIRTDNMQGGETVADYLHQIAGDKANVVNIMGLLGMTVARERSDGFMNKLVTTYTNMTLLDFKTAMWDRTTAFNLMQGWLTTFPEIDGVFAANDDMGLGAVAAIQTAGKTGQIKVVGYDGVPEALTAIQNGTMAGTIAQDPYIGGWLSVKYGVMLAGKEEVPLVDQIMLNLVTTANVTAYKVYSDKQVSTAGLTISDVNAVIANDKLTWLP